MLNRRGFLRHAAAASVVCVGCGLRHAVAQPAPRREIAIGGRRIRTVDVHAHCAVPAVLDVVKGTPFEREAKRQLEGNLGFPVEVARVNDMNKDGIDVQALSINAYWYAADRDLARRIYDVQAAKIAEMCQAIPGRFVGYAPVALQHPEIAAEQLEHGMKQLGLVGAAIGGNVEGEEIASAKFDPFWKKAEELQALVFIHPQTAPQSTGIAKRVEGSGALGNVIGNPLETSLALIHLIFEGTLDKFPNLKICGAHGGGFLPSYAARMDHGCSVFPDQCKGPTLKKKPSEYLKQLYFDTLVFTGEALRHLVAEHGASQLMIGTDYAVPWVKGPVDHVLNTPGLSDEQRVAILGGNAAKLIKLPA
ncbi:MAG: aminocarboxymuconate-semialdehyde decarboxylase [Alphaproteobacteria bacterium]|jgi:aminocarboxymuconate-semialdehyde decarboxylase|nr:aminocarboxymuconate-semialdehyde decarboxylase [Alphaproteobacteria bacterium]